MLQRLCCRSHLHCSCCTRRSLLQNHHSVMSWSLWLQRTPNLSGCRACLANCLLYPLEPALSASAGHLRTVSRVCLLSLCSISSQIKVQQAPVWRRTFPAASQSLSQNAGSRLPRKGKDQ